MWGLEKVWGDKHVESRCSIVLRRRWFLANYGGLDVGLEKEVWGDKHVESWVFDRSTYLHRTTATMTTCSGITLQRT